MKREPARVVDRKVADENNEVVSLEGGGNGYRRSPCGGCPWVKENTGSFPAKAFEHSAPTNYDMSMRSFACHEAGKEVPLTCAGFLLRGADNSLATRIKASEGTIDLRKVHEDGRELHESYAEMAIANGVDPSSPALAQCRPSPEELS